jgi:nicotinamidase-related amidase
MGKKKTALLVIDVQQGLFERSTPIFRADLMLDNINLLVDAAHNAGVPVIYIQHNNDKLLKKGSRAWHFHPEIRPQMGDLNIHKLLGNAFADTPLDDELQARGIDQIIATGLVTQGCVRATCLGGLELGYQVMLASDAHSTYSKRPDKVIERWQAELVEAGVRLLPAKEISFQD